MLKEKLTKGLKKINQNRTNRINLSKKDQNIYLVNKLNILQAKRVSSHKPTLSEALVVSLIKSNSVCLKVEKNKGKEMSMRLEI